MSKTKAIIFLTIWFNKSIRRSLVLDQKLKELMVEKNFFLWKKNYSKIKVDADDDLPLNKTLKFPTVTIIVRSVFQKNKKIKSSNFFWWVFVCIIKMSIY